MQRQTVATVYLFTGKSTVVAVCLRAEKVTDVRILLATLSKYIHIPMLQWSRGTVDHEHYMTFSY